ncbi:MAG: glutathione S-transferase [Methylobacter sp.]
MTNNLPILYSFCRCPYAIRARLAIAYAGIPVEIREVALRDKPEQMLAISPKGTVPVLHLPNGRVIEESLDIMQWALNQNDPGHWLNFNAGAAALITWNDSSFKYYLDRYKYADRYPQFSKKYYRKQATVFIKELENRLMNSRYLGGNDFSLVDAAIFPFIRQFAGVDNAWFQSSGYQSINDWLEKILKSELFLSVMAKYPLWIPE